MAILKVKTIAVLLFFTACISVVSAQAPRVPEKMNCDLAKRIISLSIKEKEIFEKRVKYVDQAMLIVIAYQYNSLTSLTNQANTWITRNCKPV